MNRLEKLVNNMPEGIDAILVSSKLNQFYLTEYNFDDGYVLVTRGKSHLFTDGRYIETAKAQVKNGFAVELMKGKQSEFFGKVFEEESVKTIGYEDNVLTCAAFDNLKKNFPDYEFKPVGRVIEDLREFKDEREIADIEAAQRIAEKAFDHILNYINRDRTEIDVALELEFFMRSQGSTGISFDIIAVSGTASSQPHGEPRNVKLENGFFTMDFGAVVNGYHSDMTRTIFIGKAGDEEKFIYNTVLEAQLKSIEAIQLGAKCADADIAAREVITNAGYGDKFCHSLGHGVGLQIHESPGLHSNAGDKLLEIGHVVTAEPGIYIEGKYGVRIEDMIAITPNGAVNLTNCPKHLIEVC